MIKWLTEHAQIIVVILGISLAFEILLNTDLIVMALMAGFFLYYGLKKRGGTTGTILFIIGVFMSFATLLHSFTLRIFAFILVIAFFVNYSSRDKENAGDSQGTVETADEAKQTNVQTARFQNRIFGNQTYDQEIFDMEDINIQYGFGDTTIDLSLTIIPPGETIIMLRGIAGNIKIYLPFEAQFSIHHSVVAGNVHILGEEKSCLNESILYQTPHYDNAGRKVKILTSAIIGNLEVRNV
ncbi:lia operon protein LiaF [Melghiribacillus thermohalophilus]|uniref:Lia operon protein LiaF n=1 Tax=Melghiribacillus thermohalophilus TaxID=1324956 RepID=A0A4R3N9I6_9BACI|nr:cell wall-active antibiotics response protein LiaF [Melghiribacillus thermohalophilus]TCT23639.1 lia operon protein LiaF [Melghiribacillus thermohalophilus]